MHRLTIMGDFGRRAVAPSLAICAFALGGCAEASTTERVPPQRPSAAELPTSYRFELTSSCGERNFLGRYRIVVRDGVVETVEPLRPIGAYQPPPEAVPTGADLLAMAEDAGPGSIVDLVVDPDGFPVSLRIDHVPNATDDETCYEVGALKRLDD